MLPALVPSLALAIVYLVSDPPSADLAAQTFRTEFFEEHGVELWSNAWYGGHHLPGYSLLYPPLASVLGVKLVGALAAVAAALAFAALVRPRYGERADLAIVLFSLGTASNLFTGRLTFALGVALGMCAALAFERRHLALSGFLAALSSLASPVAGLFVAFGGAVAWLTGQRREGVILAAPALAAIVVISFGFPTGGIEPFEANTFVLIAPAALILILMAPPEERAIRLGAGLYLAMCLALFVIDTPIGGNATRFGAMLAAPMLALAAVGRRPAALIVLALIPLVYWQWVAPVRDVADAAGEDSVEREYYEPVLAELADGGESEPFRVHVPATRNRWEAVFIAESYPMGRGWMRQLESGDFDLFQDGNLTAAAYREWLDERGIAYVAISLGAEPDYLAEDEIDLIHEGLPYLREIWSSPDWELYAVDDPVPLADPPARLTELATDGFTLDAPRAGEYLVRVKHTPYWEVVSGSACVEAGGDWTLVRTQGAGPVEVKANLSLGGFADALTGTEDETCSE